MSDLDDQRFNDTLRRMLAMPHKPLGKPQRSENVVVVKLRPSASSVLISESGEYYQPQTYISRVTFESK